MPYYSNYVIAKLDIVMWIREQIIIYDKKQLSCIKVVTQFRIKIQDGILNLSLSKLKIDLQMLERVKYILSFISTLFFFLCPWDDIMAKLKSSKMTRLPYRIGSPHSFSG